MALSRRVRRVVAEVFAWSGGIAGAAGASRQRTIEEFSGRPDALDAKWTAFSYACKRHIAVSQLAEMPARNRPYGYAVESRQSDADFIKTHCWNWPTKVGRER
jgi:hypothetical protein